MQAHIGIEINDTIDLPDEEIRDLLKKRLGPSIPAAPIENNSEEVSGDADTEADSSEDESADAAASSDTSDSDTDFSSVEK